MSQNVAIDDEVEEFSQHEKEEYHYVIRSDAVIDPRTVVVKLVDAPVTVVAVSAPLVLLHSADRTQRVLINAFHQNLVKFLRRVRLKISRIAHRENHRKKQASHVEELLYLIFFFKAIGGCVASETIVRLCLFARVYIET